MRREQLFQLHTDMCVKANELLVRKNQDYADDHDVFGNLDMPEAANLCSTEEAIVVRMLDKMSRLVRLLRKGHEQGVKDESIEDTLLDVINYAVLMQAKLNSRKEASNEI